MGGRGREKKRKGQETRDQLSSVPLSSPAVSTPSGAADVMSEFGHLSSTSLTHSKTHPHLKREGLTTLMALHSPTVQSRQ